MNRTITLLFALLLCRCARTRADQTITLFDNNVSTSPATRDWKFNMAPVPYGQQARLSLDARIEWPSIDGSNPWIKVLVNNKLLAQSDLLNKPNDFLTRGGLDLTWFNSGAWRVVYSPDFEQADTRQELPMAVVGGNAYHFAWDITPYLKAGDNDVRIINLQVLFKPTQLVLRKGEVVVGSPIARPAGPDDTVSPSPTGPLRTYVDEGARRLPLKVFAGPGWINIDDGADKELSVTTKTSMPGGGWWFSPDRTSDDRLLTNGDSWNTRWQTPTYSVDRRIEIAADHVHVLDTFTNTTHDLIGVIVQHRLQCSSPFAHVLVSGVESTSSTTGHNGAQPSVFARLEKGGVGMVADDDIFRAHVMEFHESNVIGLADDKLGVEPSKPVTLEWSIYPVTADATHNGDYWDFINNVRRDWDINYAIPGPFDFVGYFTGLKASASAVAYGDWIQRRDLKIVSGNIAQFPDGKYAHGTGILFAPDWVATNARWVAKIHQGAPGVKVLCYFHAQISTEPGGEVKYAADREYDSDGSPLNYPYTYILPTYLPTKGSIYGRALWGFLHTILDTIGADGIYWDEMAYSQLEYNDRAPWDGHTVHIDSATHAVTGKFSSVPLLMQPLRLDFVHYLRQHDKVIMANMQPITRTMMQEHIVRFVETGTYSDVTNTNLGCPLGLGNHEVEESQTLSALHVRRILQRGGLYYGHVYEHTPAPWNFTSVMYPITPARLGPGFVIGRERILTAISGRFGFSDGAAADVYVIDANGDRVAHPLVQEVSEHGRRFYEIRMPSDNFAVLVKR